MRKRIFEIIEIAQDGDKASRVYDTVMMITIILSLIPLAFKNETLFFSIVDKVTVTIFILDYILRWTTADYKLNKKGWSFLLYPISFMAIIDFVSILPSIIVISQGFRLFKVFRLFRTLRVFRIFKAVRYSKNITMLKNVIKRSSNSLYLVCVLALGYIVISALVIFNVEPDTFHNFFDAIYWATVSLTTVGYGDIFAVSVIGKIITMISSLFGVAIVALPAGIITAGYMQELEESRKAKEEPTDHEENEPIEQ